jgi:ribosomal-protein-alanine N-acetyltransferase
MPLLETSRLILRDVQIEDIPDYLRYSFDPRFYAHLSQKPTEENVRERVEKWIAQNVETPRMAHIWSIVKKDNGRVIGNIRLWPNKPPPILGIGYALDPEEWGNGFATEALIEVTEFAHNVLKSHRIESEAHAENAASCRVMEKAGYIREGEARYRFFMQDKWWPLTYLYASVRPDLVK